MTRLIKCVKFYMQSILVITKITKKGEGGDNTKNFSKNNIYL